MLFEARARGSSVPHPLPRDGLNPFVQDSLLGKLSTVKLVMELAHTDFLGQDLGLDLGVV